MGEIGKRAAAAIRDIAHKNNQTYAQTALSLGIARQSIAQWENSKSEPTAITLKKLAEAGYDVHYILTGVKK